MHTFGETGAGVPAFLAKLWRLVDDPDTSNLICWSKDGRSFIIQNQAQFARELLPLNYKHNNMASFIRQLNMYGFHKITSIDNGGLKFDRDEMEFSHPCFKRNCPYLLEHIKRKIANTKSLDEKAAMKPEAVTKVLQDVKAMRGRQDSLDSRFSVMKQENEALWREIASLRQKHAKQQQIVNKLIQFLITIVQPSRNVNSVKRHMQLMINDTPENAKMRKTSETESDCGPVIHELGEELLDEVAEVDPDLIYPHSPYSKMPQIQHEADSPSPLHNERPHSRVSTTSQNYEYSNQSAEDVLIAAAASACASPPATVPGNGNGSAPPAAKTPVRGAIYQSINPDGTRICYHVTEIPDAQLTEINAASPTQFSEDSVLTTPMVREEMARSQLKQKGKRRKQPTPTSIATSPVTFVATDGASTSAKASKIPRLAQQATPPQQQHTPLNETKLHIKSEEDIDPMLFLNVYPDNHVMKSDPPMISPSNLSEDSRHSVLSMGLNVGGSGAVGGSAVNAATNADSRSMLSATPELYNPNEFLSGDMPADIFEDAGLLNGDSNTLPENLKMQQQQQQQQQQEQQQQQQQLLLQQQFGQAMADNGKFSSYIVGNSGNGGASTSAAAAAASSSGSMNKSPSNGKSPQSGGGKSNEETMTIAKYRNAGTGHEDVMRDEVTGHLDNVTDELESLRDLLRGDGYSLDPSTLMGTGLTPTLNYNRSCAQALDGDFLNKLFNDTDILAPYGLSLNPENSNDKKGSELISYNPIYDFSDIMNLEDKSDLSADAADVAAMPSPGRERAQQPQYPGSVLNTPQRE